MPLSPSETSRLLDKFNHRPKKKLGQNFLTDGNIVHKSIAMADLPDGIPVIEIGPGLGTLTKQLLMNKHQVFAIEIDENLFKNLQDSLASFIQNKQLNLIQGDAVKKPLAHLPADVKEFAVVANLPYAISSPWMESLLHTERIPLTMVLMLQKEAVQRMGAKHGSKEYNALSIFIKAAFENSQVHPVPRQCFFPIPGIDSVLVKMNRLETPFLFNQKTRSLIRKIFTQRRKQIGSLIKKEEEETKQILEKWIANQNLSRNLRPEQISPEEWRALAETTA
ncbi:MAG: ribosomal RNA small subunit methyltransferase A [Opitutae bacterium]|jgi:16S rRNA (adenine1518-N6/adenine1519-N6)-dimethyltransferase|nr:ribosomal RNA small subunit methyltransferase A [Opitutae bacterium]